MMNKLSILFGACFLGACSSPRPNEVGVDEEAIAIDLQACIAAGNDCMKGGAFPIESFLPGARSISLPANASFDAPLIKPPNAKKLVYLVVAVSNDTPDLATPHHLEIDVDGMKRSLSPLPGFTRTEIEMQKITDGPLSYDASNPPKVHVQTTDGAGFQVIWVVGRWQD